MPDSRALGNASPEIRSLLLLELVDAGFYERLSPEQTHAVLSGHDKLVRDLLAGFDGREIEKTRRFLVLFERPLDAVAMAVEYHEALQGLAAEVDMPLEGRVGIHLGEVYLWANTPEHVARGAKPLELEGPARTMGNRVLSLATGGQTLLTQSAYDLAHRAAVGETALPDNVVWMSHGSYRFVSEEPTVEIHEVGVESTALFQAPRPEDLISEAPSQVAASERTWRPVAGEPIPFRPHWMLVRSLGEANYCEIWLGKHRKTGDLQVFRFCDRREDLPRLRQQLAMVRHLKANHGGTAVVPQTLDSQLGEPPYFLESEYVDGKTLVAWARTKSSLSEVLYPLRLEIAARIAELLATAHRAGIAIGDICPANLLIREEAGVVEHVWLADVSQARLLAKSSGGAESHSSTPRLHAHPTYRAPAGSQEFSNELGDATQEDDIYALGILLYQLAAGNLDRPLGPFWDRDVHDPRLREMIQALADPEPEARLTDASEVAHRLRNLEIQHAGSEETTPPASDPSPLRGARLFRSLLKRRRKTNDNP